MRDLKWEPETNTIRKDEKTIAIEDGLYLIQKKLAEGTFEYRIEDEYGIIYDIWESEKEDIDGNIDHFYNYLDDFDTKEEVSYGTEEEEDDDSSWLHYYLKGLRGDDEDDYNYYKDTPRSYPSSYHYEPPKKKTGFYDDVTKSDTLVFHKTDSSTTMLSQVYEGKGWDVLHSCYDLDEEELFRVVDAHERLVFLGHGSSYGLIGMFGPEMALHMKGKKIFAIWCNADGYFKKYDIGQGQFITGNMPSEVWECRSAGCGNISKELMLENITYWSKLCADVTERCLEGDVKSSVDYIRKNYLEKYGNHPVTIYNCNRTQCLGEPQPLPKYEFKGEPLKPEDFPIPNFDEAEFLKNPVENIRDLPHYEPEVKKDEPKEEPKESEEGEEADGNN